MPKVSVIFFAGFAILISTRLIAADAMDDRLCNMQSREIALRISEEVNPDLSARERGQIRAIAEEICLDFASEFPGPESNNLTANGQSGTSRNSDSLQSRQDSDENEGDESGLLGDLRVIESEDRVRRPGLKRR